MTRGRTGSTAIIDELNQLSSVLAGQELFTNLAYNQWSAEVISQDYKSLEPFSYWQGKDTPMQFLTRKLFGNKHLIAKYLTFAEHHTEAQGKNAFGFKVISHHLTNDRALINILLKRNYSIVYLTRNLSRQIISGLLARQRGIYNKKDFEDTNRYVIDVNEFEHLVKWEQLAIKKDRDFIAKRGFRSLDITYEDFINNRENFYTNLLRFINVPFELPVKSNYSVMINDLEHSIINFQEVKDTARNIGMPID